MANDITAHTINAIANFSGMEAVEITRGNPCHASRGHSTRVTD